MRAHGGPRVRVHAHRHTRVYRHLQMPMASTCQGTHAHLPTDHLHPEWQTLSTPPTSKPPTPAITAARKTRRTPAQGGHRGRGAGPITANLVPSVKALISVSVMTKADMLTLKKKRKKPASLRGGSWPAGHKVRAQEKPVEGLKTFTTDWGPSVSVGGAV